MKPNEVPRCRSGSGLSTGEAPQIQKPLSEIELAKFLYIIDNMEAQMWLRRLAFERDALTIEVARLKRGDFTPEEFQNLCHNLHERPVCTRKEFAQGCLQFQEKLFGKEPGRTNLWWDEL